jgi:phosphinothricin acetyltransferase
MDTITIRPATIDDAPAIAEIYNDAVLNSTATYDVEPQTVDDRVRWFKDHEETGLPVFVAESDGVVVAWSSLSTFRGKEGYRFTVENSIYIAESYRGRGLGKRMLAGLIDSARELGLHAIVAGIDSETEASIRLHASFGFEKAAYLKEVGFKFGRWLDVVFMQLLLD